MSAHQRLAPRKRPDITVKNLGSKDVIYLDATVRHAHDPNHPASGKTPNFALARAEKEKADKYHTIVAELGSAGALYTISLDSLGTPGAQTLAFLKELSRSSQVPNTAWQQNSSATKFNIYALHRIIADFWRARLKTTSAVWAGMTSHHSQARF